MRIFMDESKAGHDPVPHRFGIVETWPSLEGAVAEIEASLREQGTGWHVIRGEGTPLEGLMAEIDVHDPPTETNILLYDADGFEAKMGYAAEDAFRFQVRHGRFLEALSYASAIGAEIAAREQIKVLRPDLKMDWLSDWDEIEKRIRAYPVMKVLTTDGDKAVRIRAWDVLVGVGGDATPVIVCEGIDTPMGGATSTMIDTDEPRRVPWMVIHLPWKLLREAVSEGRKVLIGERLC
jgi:hypothetical protein